MRMDGNIFSFESGEFYRSSLRSHPVISFSKQMAIILLFTPFIAQTVWHIHQEEKNAQKGRGNNNRE